MLLTQELDRFAFQVKGLRVSKGAQCSNRFLPFPMKWAIQLMAFSTTLHWLLAQSLFLARTDGVDASGKIDEDDRLPRPGYGITGIISVLAVLILGTIIAVMLGLFKKLRAGLGDGSNSVIFSAACHPVRPQPGTSVRKVRWADVTETEYDKVDKEIRHCGFICGRASEPHEGSLYRGSSS
jgi:hypothetical protein